VPVISQFYGIIIRMFYNDHAPPHFHAAYGEYELIVGIAPIGILEGQSPTAFALWYWNGRRFTSKSCWMIGTVAGTPRYPCLWPPWNDNGVIL
jgi:hypothetical protein